MQDSPRKRLHPKPLQVRSVSGTWIDAFCRYAEGECHLAENTVAAYRRDLRRFFQWLAGRTIPGLSIRDLADYATWLHQQKLAPASMARHLVSLKVFFRYLQLEGVLQDNLAELLGSQKLWQRVPKVLSPEQVNRLFESPTPRDPFFRRDRALLEMLYATGCRASEIAHLKLEDLRLDEGFCICRGKGDKQRLVPVGVRAVEAFRLYLAEERPQALSAGQCRGLGLPLLSRAAAAAGADLGAVEALCLAGGGAAGRSVRTPCGTVLRPISWPAGPICGRSRRCSAMRASPLRRSTPTSTRPACGRSTRSSIRGVGWASA